MPDMGPLACLVSRRRTESHGSSRRLPCKLATSPIFDQWATRPPADHPLITGAMGCALMRPQMQRLSSPGSMTS